MQREEKNVRLGSGSLTKILHPFEVKQGKQITWSLRQVGISKALMNLLVNLYLQEEKTSGWTRLPLESFQWLPIH